MSQKYAIRAISYPYDNYFFTEKPDSINIDEVFDSKEQAQNRLKELLSDTYREYQAVEQNIQYGETFGSFDIFAGYGLEDVIQKLENFYEQRTGETLESFEQLLTLPLTDEDVVEFMMVSGINQYDMIPLLDEETDLYAVWINGAQKYFGQIYGQTITPFNNNYLAFNGDEMMAEFVACLEDYCPKGELSELSNQPQAVANLLNNVGYIHYFEGNESIYIELNDYSSGRYKDMSELVQLNALLKKPWFEIRPITPTQLQQLNTEFSEKNNAIILGQQYFAKAGAVDNLRFTDQDEKYQAQLDAISHYQQGVNYARQALLTDDKPNQVKVMICNNLYRLANLAGSTATLLIKKDDDSDKPRFSQQYLLTIMNHWQVVIDSYSTMMAIDDINYFDHKLNYAITCYTEYTLRLLDIYLKNEFADKDKCMAIYLRWLSELADLLIISRDKFGDELLQRNTPVLKFENQLKVPIIKGLSHLMFNGGLDAGTFADIVSYTDSNQAGQYYEIAKKMLYQALLINPKAGTTKSILSMYVRHYQADKQQFNDQLAAAKEKFHEFLAKYPEFLGEMSYNRACIAGLENDVEEAIKYLKLSEQTDYLPSKEQIINDQDFRSISARMEFQKFLSMTDE